MRAKPTVFVVDDDPVIRRLMGRLIESEGHQVETYASAQEFLDGCDLRRAACLVLDLRMPGMSGHQLQTELAARGVPIPIIIVSAYGSVPTVVRAMKNGAVDFIEKPFEAETLLERVSEALATASRWQEEQVKRAEAGARLSRLTQREREVMDLLAGGKSVKETALELDVSPKTVHTHRTHLFAKLGVDSLLDLVKVTELVRGRPARSPA